MAKVIMIQGTMSGVGKSLLVAGLCRVLRQDGYRVAPFKAQNMAANSYITREGLEMGRAQAVQAEAAGVEPTMLMNPILLKPKGVSLGCQLVLLGEVEGLHTANEYHAMVPSLRGKVAAAYHTLAQQYDVIVIEGAGSPAELNLMENDIANMGMAELADAPVVLVGDIDRGGVFAQLCGTLSLLPESQRNRVKALVVNKFRGNPNSFDEGARLLAKAAGLPVAGVLPYLTGIDIDEEDGVHPRPCGQSGGGVVDIAVLQPPHFANVSDLVPLAATEGVSLRYVTHPSALENPDMIVLPGSINTMADLRWMRENGLAQAVCDKAAGGTVIFGICGGYQILGQWLRDPEGIEDGGGEMPGLGLLPVETVFRQKKRRTRVTATVLPMAGALAELSGVSLTGYEIHMGVTTLAAGASPLVTLETGLADGCCAGNVYATYLHGCFESTACRRAIVNALCHKKGVPAPTNILDMAAYKEEQYDRLADAVRKNLDMARIDRILEFGSAH